MNLNRFFLFSFIIILLSIVVTAEEISPVAPTLQGAPPLIPMSIIGDPSYVNGKLCNENTVIESIIDGKVRSRHNCNSEGRYSIMVVGDYQDNGKEITFLIDGMITLDKTEKWQSGKIVTGFSFNIERGPSEAEIKAIEEIKQKELEILEQQKNKTIITLTIAIVAVLIIALIIFVLMKRKKVQKVQSPLQVSKTKSLKLKKKKK